MTQPSSFPSLFVKIGYFLKKKMLLMYLLLSQVFIAYQAFFQLWCTLIVVSSLVQKHRPQEMPCASVAVAHGLSSCSSKGSRSYVQQLWLLGLFALWHAPRPGIKPLSPALAGEFFTTEPPEKPQSISYDQHFCMPVEFTGRQCGCFEAYSF